MEEKHVKKNLHVRVDPELYEKFRHISFYEHRTMTEIITRLLMEYVEEKAIDEPDLFTPVVL